MRGWDVKSDALFSYVSCEGPRRSHARNPPTHRKSQQNRRKDLLDKQRSATQARVTFDDPTFRFANTEFFSVLLRWEQRVLGSSGWRRGVTGCGDRLPKGGHIENCFDLVRHCRSMLSDAIMDN